MLEPSRLPTHLLHLFITHLFISTMARAGHSTRPPAEHTIAAASIDDPPTPLVPGYGSYTILHDVALGQLDGGKPGSELLMMPGDYEDRNDIGEDTEWRTNANGNASKRWKTTEVYQHISHHPNVVRFLRPDPWTWLPVLANSCGPHLTKFPEANRSEMYEQREDDSTDKKYHRLCQDPDETLEPRLPMGTPPCKSLRAHPQLLLRHDARA